MRRKRDRRDTMRVWMGYAGKLDQSTGWRNEGTSIKQVGLTATWRKVAPRLLQHIDRLRDAEIENRPAVEVIRRYNTPDTLIYADPPYPMETRNSTMYQHEMTDEQHIELLAVLNAHTGPVVLSGRSCPLYDDRLRSWRRVECRTHTNTGESGEEVLWINPAAARQQSAPSLFDLVAS